MKKRVHRFIVFRYQILPIDRYFQGELFGKITSINDLLERKNELLLESINQVHKISEGQNQLIAKKIIEKDDLLLFKYAVNRSIVRETDSFTEEELENWPSFLVVIWNHPEKQYLLIEERRTAFQHVETPTEAIKNSINKELEKNQLRIHIEPLFDKEEFWKIIERYKGKISSVNFELITPNMANISSSLSEELKEVAKKTNTSTTNIVLESDPSSSLNIDHDNSQIEGLVDYSSKGGGNIRIKAIGIKKMFQTTKTKKGIEIDEIEFSASSVNEIVEMLKGLMS
jgi:hypothetical protein